MKAANAVVCIIALNGKANNGYVHSSPPKKDETYHVLNVHMLNNGKYYELYEYPEEFGRKHLWNRKFFREIDEAWAEEVLSNAQEEQEKESVPLETMEEVMHRLIEQENATTL